MSIAENDESEVKRVHIMAGNECCRCLMVEKNVFELPCTHLVCYNCLTKNNKTKREVCDICKNVYNKYTDIFRCHYCNEEILQNVLKTHHEVCLEYPLECPNDGCIKDNLKKEEVISHLQNDCEYETIQCGHIGCEFTTKRKYMEEHESNRNDAQTHLKLLQKHFNQTITRLDTIEKKLANTEGMLQTTTHRLDEALEQVGMTHRLHTSSNPVYRSKSCDNRSTKQVQEKHHNLQQFRQKMRLSSF